MGLSRLLDCTSTEPHLPHLWGVGYKCMGRSQPYTPPATERPRQANQPPPLIDLNRTLTTLLEHAEAMRVQSAALIQAAEQMRYTSTLLESLVATLSGER